MTTRRVRRRPQAPPRPSDMAELTWREMADAATRRAITWEMVRDELRRRSVALHGNDRLGTLDVLPTLGGEAMLDD